MTWPKLFSLALLSFGYFTHVHAFNFTVGKAAQCSDLTVSWTGGTPPFSLLLVPAFGTPQNISIPSSAFTNGQGTLSTQLKFNETETIVAVMSDATGFSTGGTSDLINVGASEGVSCDAADPGTDFVFSTPNSLQQCRPFSFIGLGNAQFPITVYGLIPSGTSFVLHSSPGATTYQWTANVAAGTSMIFVVADNAGRQGGATDLLTVGRSDIDNCLDNTSPSSTIASSTPTATGGANVTPSSDTTTSKTSVPAITGAVVGVLVFLSALIGVGIFFYKRRRNSSGGGSGGIISPFRSRRNRHSQRVRSDFDLMGDKTDPFTGSNDGHADVRNDTQRSHLPPGHEPSPFMLSPLPPSATSYYHDRSPTSRHGDIESLHSHYQDAHSEIQSSYDRDGPPTDPFRSGPTHSPQSSMSAAQRKRAMAGVPAYTPSRFILHTDLEDTEPTDEGEVVELPPQYSERRAPLNAQALSSTSSSRSTPALHLHSQDPNAEVGQQLRP